jgi:hypothetical protein
LEQAINIGDLSLIAMKRIILSAVIFLFVFCAQAQLKVDDVDLIQSVNLFQNT